MAEFEGEQNIPSELLDSYRATLNPHPTGSIVKKRYPYRMPPMQEGGRGVSTKQNEQRARFKNIRDNFATLSQAERQRWYDNMPPWASFLWYYNYFIMSGLAGNADWKDGGFGVIKSIQFVKETVQVGGNKTFVINTVDAAKSVVMMFGNSYISDKVQRGFSSIVDGGTNNHALSPEVDPAISEVKISGQGGYMETAAGDGQGDWCAPYASALIAAQLTVKMISVALTVTVGYSWEIIEHKAQTVYPVIDSIAATAVVISWSNTPSVPADVTIIVIEYI